MTARLMSGLVVIATFVIWVIWDIYALFTGGSRATLSVVITDFAFYSPAFTVIIGILIGHWFVPPRRRSLEEIIKK